MGIGKPIRDKSKSKSWFQRKVDAAERKKVADALRRQRELYYEHVGGDIAYGTSRKLGVFKRQGLDLGRVCSVFLRKKHRIRFLDAGTGYGYVAAGLKLLFGKRIFVTALNLVGAKPPLGKIGRLVRKAAKSVTREEEYRKAILDLMESEKMHGLVDEYRVIPIEKFEGEPYDIIFDSSGPWDHSLYFERVVEQYMKLLEPNGYLVIPQTQVQDMPLLHPTSEQSKQMGHYFSVQQKKEHFTILKKCSLT